MKIKDPGNALATINAAGAKLPINYIEARIAIQKCESIDECKAWGDKAAALATYAKQVNDRSLELSAKRIRLRAVRRCGQLLFQLSPKCTGSKGVCVRRNGTRGGGGAMPSARGREARRVGFSLTATTRALRLANIPEETFNSAVESPDPPAVVAMIGWKSTRWPLETPKGSKLDVELEHLALMFLGVPSLDLGGRGKFLRALVDIALPIMRARLEQKT